MDEDKLYNKLLEIEDMLKILIKKEIKELEILGKEDKKLRKIMKTTGFIFNDPVEWKIRISEVCPERKKIIDEKEAVFKCRKTGDYCDYDVCPKNKV